MPRLTLPPFTAMTFWEEADPCTTAPLKREGATAHHNRRAVSRGDERDARPDCNIPRLNGKGRRIAHDGDVSRSRNTLHDDVATGRFEVIDRRLAAGTTDRERYACRRGGRERDDVSHAVVLRVGRRVTEIHRDRAG